MKKTYIVPQAKAYQVRPAQIIAYSGPQIQDGNADNKYDAGDGSNSDAKEEEIEIISIWDLY